jgi:hypothetical protein
LTGGLTLTLPRRVVLRGGSVDRQRDERRHADRPGTADTVFSAPRANPSTLRIGGAVVFGNAGLVIVNPFINRGLIRFTNVTLSSRTA